MGGRRKSKIDTSSSSHAGIGISDQIRLIEIDSSTTTATFDETSRITTKCVEADAICRVGSGIRP